MRRILTIVASLFLLTADAYGQAAGRRVQVNGMRMYYEGPAQGRRWSCCMAPT